MNTTPLFSLAVGLLLPLAAAAQDKPATPPDAQAQPATTVAQDNAAALANPQPVSATLDKPADPQAFATASVPAPTPAPANPAPKSGKSDIMLNFQNASLTDVLNYLSEALGFIVIQDSPVAGTVNVVSKQGVTQDDAIDLLNSVLVEKGYAAIRNGRILKIVPRSGAPKQDIPVQAGSDPTQIPRKDGMVTQILPVRYVEAAKLVDNLRPLLSPDATMSANEASNAILLADTQTNVHRIAEIIKALDNSVSSISTIHVYPLQYADAKSLATMLTQLFTTDQNSKNNNNNNGRPMPPWANQGNNNVKTQSAAQEAATKITVVSDDQSNSVIVSAPDAAIPVITDIINRIDTNTSEITETRIFRLVHADAMELANELNSLYSDSNTGTTTTGGNNAAATRRPQTTNNNNANANKSQRAALLSKVVAVPDARTNSLLLLAAKDVMPQLALTVERLDSGIEKKQQVCVYRLENADPNNVYTILRSMFSSQGGSSNTSAQPTSGRLNQRSSDGASTNISNTLSN